MNTPEISATQLWSERDTFAGLKDDEFASEFALLTDVKNELRAIGSFTDIDGARAYYTALNNGE